MPIRDRADQSSAVSKLELSRLDQSAIRRGTMGTDLDVEQFSLYLSQKLKTNLVDRIVDGYIERTIEGASTLSVTLTDSDRSILNSGLLSSKLDVQIDGLWFRFASIDKQGDELPMVFEDREIAILREYSGWKIARRTNVTRAEFILNLIREVREFKIPVVIPELHIVQPIERYSGDITGTDPYANLAGGIPAAEATSVVVPVGKQALTPAEQRQQGAKSVLTVKGQQINATQINNANIIMAVGKQELSQEDNPRKLMVCAIMTAITESSITAIPDKAHGGNSDADSAGIFQQRPGWGTYEERMDPATSARLFYKAAKKENAKHPDFGYGDLCQAVQISNFPDRYNKYRTEADRITSAAGNVVDVNSANLMSQNQQGGSTGTNYSFWRGKIEDRHGNKIRKPENTWRCIQRLADDVDWRAFFVAGTFWYISEAELFKQKPVGIITEFMEGITGMDGNYDRNKKSGTITVTAEIGRWAAHPGSVVVVREFGPWNGRWLVNNFHRGLFDDFATITLKKPRPTLPEPLNDDSTGIQPVWYDQAMSLDKGLAGRQLYQAVLNNPKITFTNPTKQKNDILTGQIDDRVLQFLLWMADNGKPCRISALKSDHSQYTSEGNLSAHGAGRAVDIDTYNEQNPATDEVMRFIANGQVITGFNQLIGPNPLLVIPLGFYDSKVLGEHKTHIHVGWAI